MTEIERQQYRDKIVIIEDMKKREEYYQKRCGEYRFDHGHVEMKVLNWEGKEKYLIMDFRDELTFVVSSLSHAESEDQDLWEGDFIDYCFSANHEDFVNPWTGDSKVYDESILHLAKETPYYELFAEMLHKTFK